MQCPFLYDTNDVNYFWDKFPEIKAIKYNEEESHKNWIYFLHKNYDSLLIMDIENVMNDSEWTEVKTKDYDKNYRTYWDNILLKMKGYESTLDKLYPLLFMLQFNPKTKIEITRNGLKFI
jgi:hypothetical protein